MKGVGNWNVVDTRKVAPEEFEREEKRELIVGSSMVYWTTLAPNVEDYSGSLARAIASGSGYVVKGILWCGDVTADRLKWGNEFLKKRMKPGSNSEISPGALRRMKRFVSCSYNSFMTINLVYPCLLVKTLSISFSFCP